jgi:hypothetical protein
MSSKTGTLTTGGTDYVSLSGGLNSDLAVAATSPLVGCNQVLFAMSGTNTSPGVSLWLKTPGGTWIAVSVLDIQAGTMTASGTISPANAAVKQWLVKFAPGAYIDAKMALDSIGSGTVAVEISAGRFDGPAWLSQPIAIAALPQTITSANAAALAVGANGATNPVLKVDSSTASVATGLLVKGAAAAGGLALSVLSSGTNEPMTVDAKGAGVINIGGTSTGSIYLGRGAKNALLFGQTISALGTTQNSTPTAAQLLGGVVTQVGATGAGTVTLPSGTTLSAALALAQATGDSFECLFANLSGGQTLTITGNTGTTVLGTAAVPSGKFATLTFVNTGANTWSIFCVVSA